MVIYPSRKLMLNKMNIKIILGIAAAAGLAYFFTTKKGKDVLSQFEGDFNDIYSKGEETFKNVSKMLVQKGQEVADNVNA